MSGMRHQTVCGIPVSAFAKEPTPAELGGIVARMTAHEQAEFLSFFENGIRDSTSHDRLEKRYEAIAWELVCDEKQNCGGYGITLIEKLAAAFPSAHKEFGP